MGKRLLMMKEHNLLLQSEVIKQYPEILKVLEENDVISDELVICLPDKHRNFFDNILKQVLKQAIAEWKGDKRYPSEDVGEDKENWTRCSLDNQPNRYIFYIFNQLNGKSLNVGSDCIHHFFDGKLDGKSVMQLKNEATRIKRLNDLNEKIPGLEKIINNWKTIIDNSPIIITKHIETPYIDLGNKAFNLLNEYLSGKDQYTDFEEEFRKILTQREPIIREIETYIKGNLNKKFIPTREILLWLKNKGEGKVIETLKKDGIINWGTSHRIEEPGFMNSILPDLNNGLENIGFFASEVDTKRNGYIIRPKKKHQIILFSKHKDLIFNFGWIVFNEEPIEKLTVESILKYCNLYNEEAIYAVIRELENLTYKGEIKIKVELTDFEYNEIFIETTSGNYVLLNLKETVERFKGVVVDITKFSLKDMVNHVNNTTTKRYSKSELKELRRTREEYNLRQY